MDQPGSIRRQNAIVLHQENLCEDIFSLTLGCGEIAGACRPGQFVTLYCVDKSRLLPRPISICDTDRERGLLRLVYRRAGAGTEEFSLLGSGDGVEVMGPLGNGYPASLWEPVGTPAEKEKAPEGTIWLMGGGIGIPPLLLLAKELGRSGYAQIDAVLGYRDVLFLANDFEALPGVRVHIATEDGSSGAKGNVMDALPEGRPDAICACGPAPMLRAIRSFALERSIPCYLSLEQRMACGIGACLACVCRSAGVDEHSRVRNKRVCVEGPVFEAGEVLL